MDAIQNSEINSPVIRSDLSDWGAAGEVVSHGLSSVVEHQREPVATDHLDYAERMYDGLMETGSSFSGDGYLIIGSGSMINEMWNPLALFAHAVPLMQACELYHGAVWDSISVTISLSAPKGLTGAIVVGAFPYYNWFNPTSIAELNTRMTSTSELIQSLLSGDNCRLMYLSESKDVTFEIPWTYQQTYIQRQALQVAFGTSTSSIVPGTPIVFIHTLSARAVSSTTTNSQVRIFYQFKNLRFVCPAVITSPLRNTRTMRQSGVEEVMATAFAVDEVANAGSEIMAAMGLGSIFGEEVESEFKEGSYERPTAVQMAYAGDTTSNGPPPTSPIFFEMATSKLPRHPVSDFIGRKQYLMKMTTGGSSEIFYNSPTFPYGVSQIGKHMATWLRYFSMLNTFWRGTMVYSFVILGHPMVETKYSFVLSYPPESTTVTPNLSTASVLRGVCSGVTIVEVPMPFAFQSDHAPIVDALNVSAINFLSTVSSAVVASFEVVSTMLDVAPVMDILVFVSAGKDFSFYQPYAPGANNVVSSGFEKHSLTEAQCGLDPPNVVFQTRAKEVGPSNLMVRCENVEDYTRYWSRCIPYSDLSGGEPSPDLQIGLITAGWWVTDSAAYAYETQNSWYVTQDYLSFISCLFMFYRGSIAAKIFCIPTTETYKYVQVMPQPYARQQTHTPFTTAAVALPANVNLGDGTVVTPGGLQPVIDLTVPYRSVYFWRATDVVANYEKSPLPGSANPAAAGWIRHNIDLQVPGGDLNDAVFRKSGPDLAFAVPINMPPPNLWMSRGYTWV